MKRDFLVPEVVDYIRAVQPGPVVVRVETDHSGRKRDRRDRRFEMLVGTTQEIGVSGKDRDRFERFRWFARPRFCSVRTGVKTRTAGGGLVFDHRQLKIKIENIETENLNEENFNF